VCEEGICLKPACGNDAQCGAGQACLNGACTSAPAGSQVASCAITPNPAVANAGSTTQLKVVAQDSGGKALHFSKFTWSASGAGTIDQKGLVSAGAAGGDVAVTASATGGTASCTAIVHAYPPQTAQSLRVTVINMHTKAPVVGAKVVIDTSTTALPTAADGTVSLPGVTGTHDVHVFAAGYSYTSFVQTDAKDLLVPLVPYVSSSLRSGFTGHMCSSLSVDSKCAAEGEFAPLNKSNQAVHLAFFGSGIPNSLLDLSVSTLIGPLHRVILSLIGGTACTADSQCPTGQACSSAGKCGTPANLPYGLVLGLADDFFATQDYRVFADGGLRALWGIGGNLAFNDLLPVVPALTGGANVDVGKLLPKLLPLFSDLQAGATVGVKAPDNGTPQHPPTFTNTSVALTTPMRLRIAPKSPDLPTLDGAYVDGVLAVAGAMDYPLGFIPLGMTAGLSAPDGSGKNTAKIVDPVCVQNGGTAATCATNNLPLKLAAENGGAEGSQIGVALLALNFGGLTPGSATRVAVSGQIKVLDQIDYTAPTASALAFPLPTFLNLPATASVTVTKASRQVTVANDADPGVQIYRFELENNARLNWNVWTGKIGCLAPATCPRTVTLPDPSLISTDLIDPFADAVGDDGKTAGPSARLLGLEFSDASKTASALESFGSLTLDAIGSNLAAFTAVQVPVQ
jgi:hypothetical protein